MRVHRLQITAFGPFAETVDVDLDALAANGLFLLHGPTGAGKTSILDAVCFALYGVVPGARQGARLRSDHARDGVAPEVVCEFTASGRRFEVRRSPAWERPKKRGTGTTTEQARVLLREIAGGAWTPVTSRIDEAAELLDTVLGLGVEQFTKLVLLPQGEFAAFLRAGAEERRTLLERLFGTDRFAAVQQWMRETQAGYRQAVETADARASTLVARAEQAAALVGVRPGSTDSDAPGSPEERVHALVTAVAVTLDAARQARVSAQERAQHAAAEHRDAVEVERLHRRHAELRARAAALQEGSSEQIARLSRLAAARRAAGIATWTPPLADARARAAAAVAAVDAAMVALAGDGSGAEAELDDDALHARMLGDRELVGVLAAVEGEAVQAADLERAVMSARADLVSAADASAAATQEHEVAVAQQARWRADLDEAAEAAGRLDAATAAHERAETVARAAAEAEQLSVRVAELAIRKAALRERRDEARGLHLDLRERRLAGMAAELAAQLVAGASCPVCGAVEHPDPATAVAEAPAASDEQAAEAALAAAQDTLAACEAELARVTALHAAAVRVSGGIPPTAAEEAVEAAVREVRVARAAARRSGQVKEELSRAEAAADAALARLASARELADAAHSELTRHEERWLAVHRRIVDAAAGHPSVAARRAAVLRHAEAVDGLLAARRELRAATQHLAEVTEAARAAASDAGFADLDDALAALLATDDVDHLEQACQSYEQELAVVEAALLEPDLLAALGRPATDPAVTAAALELAQGDDEAAATALDRCRATSEALTTLEAELREHVAATAPLGRRYRLHADLSRCLDGTGGDNALRMSLSSYVLAARLEQVAAAASERLRVMSGGRYSLEHCDEAERGRGRSGLSLRVVDGWTGRRRDTASLSGGESFYTSLALALGLADVVTAEAGGARVETLFVDEGFGSLDEDTLQEVLDTLDGLRSGGRVVGLVSHVPDMRDRIPARLEVVKTRSGSTVRQASA